MAASSAAICNRALTFLGASRISTLTEDTVEAKLCNEHYDAVRKTLLRSHPWKFALARAVLAASSTTPDWGWTYQYPLPVNCLRVIELYGQESDNWTEEGRMLMTDSDQVSIKYIADIEDTGNFDVSFEEVLALDLAILFSYSLTTSQGLRADLVALRKEKIREARTYSAQSAVGDRVYADTWLNSRL